MKWTRHRSKSSSRDADCELVHAIADRSASAIWSQLQSSPHAKWIGAGELRGYVCALAATVIRQQAAQLAGESASSEQWTADDQRRAVERTVHTVMHRQLVDSPAPLARRRAA